MIITTENFHIRSQNSNAIYWEQGIFPAWTGLNAFRHFPPEAAGTGVEPHYHDNDEIWLFTEGRGEVWLDGHLYDITPNTIVYTPMGCVHRFQMFTVFENNAIVTPLERLRRPNHLTLEETGPPEPTVPGFVVPGADNTGPIADPGPRCPLSEWRAIALTDGQTAAEGELQLNEHWLVMEGTIGLEVDGWPIELASNDLALLRAGASRRIIARGDTRLMVVRERKDRL